MNLPLQTEPVERGTSCQALGEKDPASAMLASGITPSDAGIQPDGWEDVVGGIARVALPALAGLI